MVIIIIIIIIIFEKMTVADIVRNMWNGLVTFKNNLFAFFVNPVGFKVTS